MSKIVAVNAGSSSLKFQLLEMPEEIVLTEGVFERIGLEDGIFTIKVNGEKITSTPVLKNHAVAVDMLLKALVDYKIVSNLEEIDGVGHRVVHGGEKFNDSVVITDEVLEAIDQLSDLAPLHNPANIVGIKAFKEALPNVISVAVFDTAFHQTMPSEAYMYATPHEWYEDYSVRKYGFHGTSHKYVSERVADLLGKKDANVIICHLGNGGSLCAVKAGKSIDTTMGFTPLAGIAMGTRSGDIDPAIIPYIMEKTNQTAEEVLNSLNKKSGLLGMSGRSNDWRDVVSGASEGEIGSILAQNVFSYRIASFIGSYHVALGGADAIAFTAGIGENSAIARKYVIDRLGALGVVVDDEKNNARGGEMEISLPESKIKVFVIPTNEEVMIARDVVRLSK